MPDLLLSKLMPPRLKKGILDRPRLMELCAGLEERKVTMFIAPAGYGKTVLMLQAATAAGRPLVWYQLDSYDNDPAVFLDYLITGIAGRIPGFGTQARQTIESGGIESRLRLLVIAIINELSRYGDEPLVFAFDDYHEITEPLVHRFLQDFLEHLPAHVHVMIASRSALSLKLSRFKTAGEVLSVGMAELRFTDDETQAFLSERSPKLPAGTWQLLEDRVNGWPAAVTLAADSVSGDISGLGTGSGTAAIYAYLAAEILERQPDRVREFLQKSAVLDVMTAEDCDLLFKRNDSRQMLELLEKQNLFLIPLAGPGKAYRYHQLFREFLLERLGEERRCWHQAAGKLARIRGDLNAAVEYFRLAGAEDELKDALKEIIQQALSQGRWQTVARWLGAVPEEELAADPWLGLYRAKSVLYRGCLEEAEQWLNGAALLFAARGDEAGLAQSRLAQAQILRCRGRFEECLELLEQVPEAESAPYFDALLEKSTCLFFAGQFAEAEAVLAGALDAAKRSNDRYAMAHLMEGLGHAYFALGDYPKALQMYKKGAAPLPEWFLPSYHMQDYVAFIYLDWGEWERALDYAKRNLAVKENLGLTDALPSTYIQLANIYLSRGEWQFAEEYCNRAIDCVQENGGGIYSAISLSVKSECLSVQGRWIEALESAEKALAEAQLYNGAVETLCQLLGALSFLYGGDLQRGRGLLTMAINQFEQSGFKRGQYYGYAFQAWLYINNGTPAQAREYTVKALELSAKHNLLNVFLTHYEMLQPLLKVGLENDIEVAFIQRIFTRMGTRALNLLTGLADHAAPAVRRRTIAPLAEIGGPEAGAILLRLTKDPHADVRQWACLAAQRLGILAGEEIKAAIPAVSLQVSMLGSFKVFVQGTELGKTGWRTVKTHDLLAYLVHREGPVGREQIAEDLWPDLDAENAANIFHVTLHRLRKVLAGAGCPDILGYSRRRYSLQPDSFGSDRQRFQEMAASGLHKDTVPAEAAACLEQAVALYRGDYLEELDYPWLLPSREKLKRLYVEAQLGLARHYFLMQSYAQAIAHLHIVEEEDPFAEEAHFLLMQSYAGQGSRAAAIKQYQKLEEILRNELGLSPSVHLHNLYLKLK